MSIFLIIHCPNTLSRRLSQMFIHKNKMDLVTKSPGLHHILEEIFVNLDHRSLLECENVSIVWKDLLNNPNTWHKHLDFFDVLKNLQSLPRSIVTKVLEKQSQGNKIKFVKLKKQDDGLFGVSVALAPSSVICSCGNEEFNKEIYIVPLTTSHKELSFIRADRIFSVNGNLIEEDYQKTIDSLFEAKRQHEVDLIVVHDARINFSTSCGHLGDIRAGQIEMKFNLFMRWSLGSLRGFGHEQHGHFRNVHTYRESEHMKMIVDLPYGWKKVISSEESWPSGCRSWRLDVILEDPSGKKYSTFNTSRFDDYIAKNPSLKIDEDVTNFKVSWLSFKKI